MAKQPLKIGYFYQHLLESIHKARALHLFFEDGQCDKVCFGDFYKNLYLMEDCQNIKKQRSVK